MNIRCCHCGAIVESDRWQKLGSKVCARCIRDGRCDVRTPRQLSLSLFTVGDSASWTYSEGTTTPTSRVRDRGRPICETIQDE